jgi:hypothetical protein
LDFNELRLLTHCWSNPRETVGHFLPKLQQRLKPGKKRYGVSFYPKWLLENLPSVETIHSEKLQRNNTLSEIEIPLVTTQFKWNQNTNWELITADAEDVEALHRWSWATDGNLNLLEDWVAHFDAQMPAPHSSDSQALEWEAYNISQRIIKFCEMTQQGKDLGPIKNHILRSSQYLLLNMEYFETGYGNHLFNNLRAIYIAGGVLEKPRLRNYSRLKIVHVLSELIEYGQLREGSTHYQLLISSWIDQLITFADPELKIYLEELAQNTKSVCRKLVGLGLPLFGDISPDISPSELAKQHLPLEEDLVGPYWYSLNQGVHKILARAEPDGDPPVMNHAHNDSLHFTYTHNDTEIFVDAGRANYLQNEISKWALTSDAHNSILVENKALKPESSHRLPPAYRRCHTLIQKTANTLHMTANGLRRFKLGEVTRNIQICGESIRINDSFEGNKSIRLHFHLPEQREVRLADDQVIIDAKLVLKFSTKPKLLRLNKSEEYFGKRSKIYGGTEGLWRVTVEFENICSLTSELNSCVE